MTTFAAEQFYGEIHRAETSRRGAIDLWWGVFRDIYSAWVKAMPNLELYACNLTSHKPLVSIIETLE